MFIFVKLQDIIFFFKANDSSNIVELHPIIKSLFEINS